uniref:Blue-light photoreceptor n=1 Tax=Oryza sativa subsp. japonica TaxID=39947 RepID=Q9SXI0_ORYSJ|nr:blue-light photoreceptor [Oryza sativa Japonica Group]
MSASPSSMKRRRRRRGGGADGGVVQAGPARGGQPALAAAARAAGEVGAGVRVGAGGGRAVLPGAGVPVVAQPEPQAPGRLAPAARRQQARHPPLRRRRRRAHRARPQHRRHASLLQPPLRPAVAGEGPPGEGAADGRGHRRAVVQRRPAVRAMGGGRRRRLPVHHVRAVLGQVPVHARPGGALLPPKRIAPGELPARRCPSDELVFEDESERGSNALLARAWSPGWQNADKALAAFLNGPLMDYSVNRKKADSASTSLLSPYLHFGELSVRKVFHQVRMKQLMWSNEGNHAGDESCVLFLRSIGLREYSRYLTFNHPCSLEKPLLAHLRFFPWVVDEVYFKVWRQGRTGYPLVDAGMRDSRATGWLHDRIRVVVSSFFVKVLQLPWRWGMKYFWDTLLDGDLESDRLGWQYISGSLPDGRELDRIDNPQLEGYKFDPHGEYVRRWLPELARLPTEWIHHPWDAPESVLQAAGIELGSNYPLPIVELDAAKTRLQDALSEMWELEAASRAAMENGMEEGLGDSSDVPPIAFPPELQMEVDRAPAQPTVHGPTTAGRRREDQMVPSMTSSLVRAETELSADFDNSMDSRPEVPSQVLFQPRMEREETVDGGGGGGMVGRSNGGGHQGQHQQQQHNFQTTIHRARGVAPSTSEASSNWTWERRRRGARLVASGSVRPLRSLRCR